MQRGTRPRHRGRYIGATAGASALALFLLAGCAEKESLERASSTPAVPRVMQVAQIGGSADLPVSTPTTPAITRKVIVTAEVRLVVDNLTTAERELRGRVKEHGGYIAGTEIGGESGGKRQGTWKVRIPADRYDTFVAEIGTLGELQTIHADSQDVTEEYFDVGARLKNKKIEEQRLLAHLQRSTGRLQDILAVERELSRVRGEIERLQGRQRLLSSLTELTTVTVIMSEAKEFVAPKPTAFSTQVTRTFHDSTGALRAFLIGLVLLVVALSPWLLVFGLTILPIAAYLRRRRRAVRLTPDR